LVGLALYGDAGALDAWSAPVLAVAIHGADPATSMRQALHRGAALARLVELRGDELDSLLAGDDRAAERRVVAQRAAEGRLTPRAHFDAHGVSGAPSRLALFHCVASPFDALGPQVVRAIADRAPVAHYLGVAARELFDDEGQRPLDERSLLERWGAPSAAHLRLWREHAAPDEEHWVDVVDLPERAAVLSALSSREPPAATTHPTAFVEVHATVGLSRQVEVARDAVLAAMEEFSLAAHDVRIVASDARATVPLLGALWQPSSLEEPGSPRVQYEIADPRVPRRSLRLDAFTRLLRALDSDATAHDMAALLTAPALRDGLGLTSDEAERALRLARDGRVSVGLDADDLARRGVFEDDDDAG
ncbi:MAG: hypothetical protein ACRDV0_04075, partial [Acidimicrobiales bacterium]